jgi:GNAT superfamily N-acetyltransferase
MPQLSPLAGLTVRQELDAAMMAALQGRTEDEISARFEARNRAYVALKDGAPAAWGWVATRLATIGELGAAITIPANERYLWNFVTLKAYRGMGIYPRLLQAIVMTESASAEKFWIAYAPENHASGAGIEKAGFVPVAELSFDAAQHPALQSMRAGGAEEASRLITLPIATESLTKCWRCARAGRMNMSCNAETCRCDYQKPERGCAA